jgi:hypothetical protein
MDPGLDPFADQAAGHRIGVTLHVDGAATIHTHPHTLAGFQTLRRQRPQHRQLLGQPRRPTLVALPEQLPQKRRVRRATCEVAAAAQHQRLVQRALELVMTLLHVAVLVRLVRVDHLALHVVVPQQALITPLKRGAVAARRRRGGERIGAMHPRHATQLPQGVLQTGAQALEALGEADRPRLPVRVGQHEVVDQVRKRHAANGDAQLGAMREVGSTEPARFVDLGEKHFLGRPLHGPPLLDAPLQRPHLAVGEASGILCLQPGKQCLGQQTRVERQLFLDPRPHLREGVRACSPVMFHTHLAGQLAKPPILACRLLVDAGLGSRLPLGPAVMVEAAQTLDVQIGNHPKPPCNKGLRIGYRVQLTGKSNCRRQAMGSDRDGKSSCRRAGSIVVVQQSCRAPPRRPGRPA